jgi:hypothetical protein
MTMNPQYIQSLLAPLETQNLKLALVDGSWEPAGEQFYSDLSPVIVSPPVELTGVSIFYNEADAFGGMLFDDVQLIANDTITGTLGYVVVYIDTGDETSSRIVAWDRLDNPISGGSTDAAGGVSYSPYDGGFFQVYSVDPSAI